MHDPATLDDRAEVSFSFDGKEVSVSLYETPDLTEEEALQVVEMYADELSEHISGECQLLYFARINYVVVSGSGHRLPSLVMIFGKQILTSVHLYTTWLSCLFF